MGSLRCDGHRRKSCPEKWTYQDSNLRLPPCEVSGIVLRGTASVRLPHLGMAGIAAVYASELKTMGELMHQYYIVLANRMEALGQGEQSFSICGYPEDSMFM